MQALNFTVRFCLLGLASVFMGKLLNLAQGKLGLAVLLLFTIGTSY